MELLLGSPGTLRFPEQGSDWVELTEAPAVVITNAAGEEVGKELKVSEATEDAKKYWTVEVPAQAEVDLLTATWTSTEPAATYTTHAEVVGGFAVSLSAIEEKFGESVDVAKLEAIREVATSEIEGACGLAFRARYGTELADGSGGERLILQRTEILRLLEVEVDGQILTAEEIAAIVIAPPNVLIRDEGRWPMTKRSNIRLVYAHGKPEYPDARFPVRDYAAYLLTETPSDWQGRATSFTNEIGTTYSLVTPGVRGASFPLPSVNAFCDRHATALVG